MLRRGPPPASVKDIDIAVAAARKAFQTTWGKNVTGFERSKLLNKLADLMERDAQELAELESLNNGKPVRLARCVHSLDTRGDPRTQCVPKETSISAILSHVFGTMLVGLIRSLVR